MYLVRGEGRDNTSRLSNARSSSGITFEHAMPTGMRLKKNAETAKN